MNDILAYTLLLAHDADDPATAAALLDLADDPERFRELMGEVSAVREAVEQPDPEDGDVTDAGLVSLAMVKAKAEGDDELLDQLAALADDPEALESLLDQLAIDAEPKQESSSAGRTPPRPGLVWKDATKRWVRDPSASKAAPKKTAKAANMATAKGAVVAALADPSSVQPEQLSDLAGHLKSMTVAELKGHLKGVKGKVSGTKLQLVDRLLEHVKGGGGKAAAKPDITSFSDDELRAEYERRFGGGAKPAPAEPAAAPAAEPAAAAAEQPKPEPKPQPKKKAEPAKTETAGGFPAVPESAVITDPDKARENTYKYDDPAFKAAGRAMLNDANFRDDLFDVLDMQSRLVNTGGLVQIPSIVNLMKEKRPDLTTAQVHAALMPLQDRAEFHELNEVRMARPGGLMVNGRLLYYIRMNSDPARGKTLTSPDDLKP